MTGRALSLIRRLPPWLEMALVIVVAFGDVGGWFAALMGRDVNEAAVDPNEGILALVVVEIVRLALILPFLHLRGWPLRSLVPRVTLRGAAVGVALCAAAFLLNGVLKKV